MYNITKHSYFPLFYLFCLLLIPADINAEAKKENIEEITVNSTRIEQSLYQVPSAISVVNVVDIQKGRQLLGLDESLVRVPGLFMQNRYNFAQDLRIAIRGFGARAAFGIRGVKIYVDGIPATLPDGQGGVDSIDLGSADRIEVIRGPSSSLYGSAAGGVINVYSEQGTTKPFVEGRYSLGEYDFNKYQLKTGGQTGPVNYLFNVSRLELDGYRNHSKTENVLINSRLRYDIDNTSSLTAVINAFDSPIADDPGALTATQVNTNPRQARTANVLFDAGEAIAQQKLGLVYKKSIADNHELIFRNYYVWRDFSNKLPFTSGGIVNFDRFFVGGGAQYNYSTHLFGRHNQFIIGIDIDSQEDDRRRFNNNDGATGLLSFAQKESVDSYGLFIQDELFLSDSLKILLGFRYDEIGYDIADSFLSDGNDSGDITFDDISPLIAMHWMPSEHINLYAKISTSFETPTTTELANPSGGGGFNTALEPQKARNYEVGIKGRLPDQLHYELSIYHIDIEDELVPFELPAFPGRDFFRNAGKSERQGLEAGISFSPVQGLRVSGNYTYSDYEYKQFTTPAGTFDGNDIPGIPAHQGYLELAYTHPSGFYSTMDMLWVDEFFANDINTVRNDSYLVANLRAGYEGKFGNWRVSPHLGLNNLFDESYNGNVRLNAFGNRFFEPAPDFNAYAGFTIKYSPASE